MRCRCRIQREDTENAAPSFTGEKRGSDSEIDGEIKRAKIVIQSKKLRAIKSEANIEGRLENISVKK